MENDDLEEALKGMDKDSRLPKNSGAMPPGGLIVKRSRCCGAPVVLTGQGILQYICSKCKKAHRELIMD